MYYLAYGSNLNLSEMKEKCPFYKVIGRMFLYNYMLSFKGCLLYTSDAADER